MGEHTDRGPDLAVEQHSVRSGSTSDGWFVTWRLTNLGEAPLTIHTSRLPHGRFRGPEKTFQPPLELAPNASLTTELPVACDYAGGSDVENAFLILSVRLEEQAWLILARLRVSFGTQHTPLAETELVSAQPVGFSARLDKNERART